MLNQSDMQALTAAKVGDLWFVDALRIGVTQDRVTKVTPTTITIGHGTRVNKRTGQIIGGKSYAMVWFYPATPARVAEFAPRIRLQHLQTRFRRLVDDVMSRHHAGQISADAYEAMIAAMTAALSPAGTTADSAAATTAETAGAPATADRGSAGASD